MSKLVLITGGARSGKSSHALELCEQLGEKRLFIATCPSIDGEMNDRVQRHKQEREGRGWDTVEETVALHKVIRERGDEFDVLLIDCLTLWVNNILYSCEKLSEQLDDFTIKELTTQWLEASRNTKATVICVTNEVGLGIVPDNALARRYRDLVGTVNQTIGKSADRVTLVSCGVPLHLKNNFDTME